VISRLRGTLLSREGERIELATPGGVVYEVEVPLTVVERLPAVGQEVELHIVFLVRDDAQSLYGLLDPGERALFQRLLTAKGVGGKQAVKMLSTYPARRLVQILAERNVPALTRVSGIGKKTAETLAVALSDRVDDLDLGPAPGADGAEANTAQAAVQALIVLGMGVDDAERAVRAVLSDTTEPMDTEELVRRALAKR
jgi:holliday junction DNA helicase RuvA